MEEYYLVAAYGVGLIIFGAVLVAILVDFFRWIKKIRHKCPHNHTFTTYNHVVTCEEIVVTCLECGEVISEELDCV